MKCLSQSYLDLFFDTDYHSQIGLGIKENHLDDQNTLGMKNTNAMKP